MRGHSVPPCRTRGFPRNAHLGVAEGRNATRLSAGSPHSLLVKASPRGARPSSVSVRIRTTNNVLSTM